MKYRPQHGRWFLFALLPLSAASLCFGQKKVWEYENGKWPQITQAAPQPVSDPEIDRAEGYLSRGAPSTGRAILLAWEKTHKDSPVRDRAIYLIAQSYFDEDERILSFYYLDEVMEEYPESRLFYVALARQYQIADEYLNGHKRKFLGMAILSAEDEAIEMLYRVQQRSPGSDLAQRALLRTADYYYNSAQYDFAGDAYASFVKSFPRSPDVARARLRQAFSSLAQFRGLKFDPTPIEDARAQLLDIKRDYPDLASEEHVGDAIDRIDSAFASKLLVTGEFYQRTGELKAAAYFYRFLTDTYASSPEAAEAQKRLVKLPESAKGPPYPPPSNGFAPATRPAVDVR